jgi:hypothetical protein
MMDGGSFYWQVGLQKGTSQAQHACGLRKIVATQAFRPGIVCLGCVPTGAGCLCRSGLKRSQDDSTVITRYIYIYTCVCDYICIYIYKSYIYNIIYTLYNINTITTGEPAKCDESQGIQVQKKTCCHVASFVSMLKLKADKSFCTASTTCKE